MKLKQPPSPPSPPGRSAQGGRGKHSPPSAGIRPRELFDELVFVFVIVMFIKMFLVEHYKIPSGSMTPTLLGGTVIFVDVNGDQAKDLVYWENHRPLVFTRQGDRYLADDQTRVTGNQLRDWEARGLVHEQFDHILVNRLAYWFRWPRRGEIVVFKVPPAIFKIEAPIYVKRLVGEPGDRLTFTPDGHLIANDRQVTRPDFFRTQRYEVGVEAAVRESRPQPDFEYHPAGLGRQVIDSIHVAQGEAIVMGDNTRGSLDSRYWGGVPLPNFKGRAFLRIWPLTQFKLLQ